MNRKERKKQRKYLVETQVRGRRVLCNVRLELEAQYGEESICGYVRKTRTHGGEVTGICSLIDGPCKRPLPMTMKKCGVYLDWISGRRINGS